MINRKFFVGGNWKMNGNKQSIDGIVDFLKMGLLDLNIGMFNGDFYYVDCRMMYMIMYVCSLSFCSFYMI